MDTQIANSAQDKIHFKNLDGIRAMAAIMVILSHLPVGHTFPNEIIQKIWEFAKNGRHGVYIFFVLSGFLITRLILSNTNFTLKKFYLKRIYRIWPLYYLVLAINFLIILPLLNINNQYPGNNIWLHLFFLSNFNLYDLLINGTKLLPALNIGWSVSIEEQFYLFWPLIFIFFTKNKTRIVFIFILMVISMYFTNNIVSKNGAHNFTTTSAIWDLGFGALLAFFHLHLKNQLIKIPKLLNIAIYFFIISYLSKILDFNIHLPFERFLNSLCYGYLIFEQCTNSKNIFQLDKIPLFSYLGKISYGIYLLHPLCLLVVDSILVYILGYGLLRNLLIMGIGIPFIFFTSHISYRYYESYFLRLKEKIG